MQKHLENALGNGDELVIENDFARVVVRAEKDGDDYPVEYIVVDDQRVCHTVDRIDVAFQLALEVLASYA